MTNSSARAVLCLCRLAGLLPYQRDPEHPGPAAAFLASPSWRMYSVAALLSSYIFLQAKAVPLTLLHEIEGASIVFSKTFAIVNINFALFGGLALAYCLFRQHSELLAILNRLTTEQLLAPARLELSLIVVLATQGFVDLLYQFIFSGDSMQYLDMPFNIAWDVFGMVIAMNMVLFTYFVRRVLRHFRSLNSQARELTALKLKDSHFHDLSEQIAGIRAQHRGAVQLLADLCHCFGPQVALFLLWSLGTIVCCSFVCLPALFTKPLRFSDTIVAFSVPMLVPFIACVPAIISCNDVSEEGNETADLCQDFLNVNYLSEREVKEASLLVTNISLHPVRCKLIGIIAMDNKVFLTGLSSIISYMIVLLQFQSSFTTCKCKKKNNATSV